VAFKSGVAEAVTVKVGVIVGRSVGMTGTDAAPHAPSRNTTITCAQRLNIRQFLIFDRIVIMLKVYESRELDASQQQKP
jgi:hypothetical protein